MNYKIRSIGAALRSSWRYAVLAAVAPALLLTAGQAAAREGVKLLGTMTLPGQAITTFDISYVDTTLGIYLLADRTNAAVDVFDTSSNQLIGQYSSTTAPFAGAKSSNDISGPDGVMIVEESEIWAGDGDSTVKVFDVYSGALLGVMNTLGKKRVDEMCASAANHLGMVANNADDPPFVTIIGTLDHAKKAGIAFDGKAGPLATNGIEQCVAVGNHFYLSVPELNGPGDNSAAGAIVAIDMATLKVDAVATLPHSSCAGPQGLAVGPADATIAGATDLIVGCNASSSTVVVAVEGNGVAVVKTIPWQGGADEVDYNAADNSYYLAEGSPSYSQYQRLGSIDADTLASDIAVRTGIKSGTAGISHGNNHSVAADALNNQVYVPIASTSGSTYCPTPNGCIGIFRSQAP